MCVCVCARTRRERMTRSCERKTIPSNSQRSSFVTGSFSTVQTGKPLCEQVCACAAPHVTHVREPGQGKDRAPKHLRRDARLRWAVACDGSDLQHILDHASTLNCPEHLDVARHRVRSSKHRLRIEPIAKAVLLALRFGGWIQGELQILSAALERRDGECASYCHRRLRFDLTHHVTSGLPMKERHLLQVQLHLI